MKSVKIQLRGICQACGSEQACTKGAIANHGYTVDWGMFNGTCRGSGRAPLNTDHSYTDEIVASLNEQAVATVELAARLQAGQADDHKVKVRQGFGANKQVVEVEFGSLRLSDKSTQISRLHSNAKLMEQHAQTMQELKARVFGTAVAEVAKSEGPAPIERNERRVRILGNGKSAIVACDYTHGGRVYYTVDGVGSPARWMGVAAWRKLPHA